MLLAALLVGAATAAGAPAPAPSSAPSLGSVTLTLRAPAYQLAPAQDGYTDIQAEGYSLSGAVGAALLPHQLVDVGLPPDIDWDSLTLTVTDAQTAAVPGTFNLRTAVPDAPNSGPLPDSLPQSWGRAGVGAGAIATIAATGQMRKWRLARVDFCPFQYDEATGQLGVIEQATVELRFKRTGEAPSTELLADTVQDDEAVARLVNYEQARTWYPHVDRASALAYDYVIITTNAIAGGAGELGNFVAHKQAKGHNVLVVTETAYDPLTGQAPNGRAEKVRQWLINNYAASGIKYVLLIGNPTPDGTGSTDVPMKMCWPRRHTTSYRESPTDYFFADLTGNWDLNGNGYYGEWVGDLGAGGVDLTPEVYVGRIPFYGSYADVNAILRKTMTYESSSSTDWRKTILLPMSFSQTGYDGAPLAEQMWDDYLNAAGYGRWRQYQQGSGPCGPNSIYPSEEELRSNTVVNRWKNNVYGIVCWWGHGSATSASVGYDSCWDGTLFSNSQPSQLNDSYPAMIYQCSCLNGYPENASNLQYALLKRGGAATVSASRVSWFNTGVGYGQFDGSSTNSGIGYEYVERLVMGQTTSEALYNAKSGLPLEYDSRLMNMYDFNLYGDPGLSLLKTVIPQPPVSSASVSARYTINTGVPVSWQGSSPDGVSIKWYTIQVRDDAVGTWSDWLVNTTLNANIYTGVAGHTYRFRSIATDQRDVVETDVPADGDAIVTVAAARLVGQINNNRGEPAFPAQVTASPAALNQPVTLDGWGNYELFFAANGTYDITAAAATAKDQSAGTFGVLPPLKNVAVSGDTAATDLVLPPSDEAIVNGQFESGLLVWHPMPAITLTTQAHTGDYAMRLVNLGSPATLSPAIWQATTIPMGWDMVTLSVFYQVVGGNAANDDIWLAVTGPTQEITIPLSVATGGWVHAWQDVRDLTGQPVTVSLHADLQSALVLALDEISLGPGASGPLHVFLPLALRNSP